MVTPLPALLLLYAAVGVAPPGATTLSVDAERTARRVDDALARAASFGAAESQARLELWRDTARAVSADVGEDAPLLMELRNAIRFDTSERRRVNVRTGQRETPELQYVRVLTRIRDDLRFTPRREAEMPPGFPEPAPVGCIVIATYPAYRAAFVNEPQAGRNEMFFKLFEHIKANGIAMTAPVEMTHQPAQPRGLSPARPTAMAFLYERPDQGQTGEFDGVVVRDVPAMTVISFGVRGSLFENHFVEHFATLRRQLDSRPEWKQAGPPRVLGYNSPFNWPSNRLYEVQIPVVAAEK